MSNCLLGGIGSNNHQNLVNRTTLTEPNGGEKMIQRCNGAGHLRYQAAKDRHEEEMPTSIGPSGGGARHCRKHGVWFALAVDRPLRAASVFICGALEWLLRGAALPCDSGRRGRPRAQEPLQHTFLPTFSSRCRLSGCGKSAGKRPRAVIPFAYRGFGRGKQSGKKHTCQWIADIPAVAEGLRRI